ncbi:uncharacterized membrane protein YsdA (DUF1294 family) [Symbiobacterium terraclitae]|uniref:Uncharacterized membrane protein YsdA (DUF1294 family) n=1 Tax=Symbiobacterium terraclitae TaxID=557451 RepID=A0ABS4JWW5_9FIRM|nr:uncharacterized membrane protein YsdA (DUF1294 family) [Symbiobacterium terraclitae]
MRAVKGWSPTWAELVAGLAVLYNFAVFLAYAWDKLRARRGGRRVPERTLLCLAALGGGAGAFCGTYLIRHKTRKARFTIGVPAALVAQVALAAWAVTQLR